MHGIVTRSLKQINTIKNAIEYSNGLLLTKGRKVCTELAESIGRSHDAVQRDLNAIAKHPEELDAHLLSNSIEKNRENPGYLIVDNTVLVKEHAKQIEGMSYQHISSQEKQGIGITAVVWTDLIQTKPVSLFVWKKGDASKVKTATNFVISLAQKINAQGVLADGLFASIEAIDNYSKANVPFVMRFHSNRVVSIAGYGEATQVKKHVAFKFKKNQRCIIKKALWQGLEVCIVALKIYHALRGWTTMFLVTNRSMQHARQVAALYKHRWKIEVFFRTCKQRFGLGHCQARSLAKQKAHCLAVFFAYSRFHESPIIRTNRKNNTIQPSSYTDSFRSLVPYA